MQKLLAAGLSVLVLFLLAANSRLEDRRAALERRLEAFERRPRPAGSPAPIVLEPPSAPVVVVPPTAPAPQALRAVALSLPGREVPGLTPEQKLAIAQLRDSTDSAIRSMLTPEQREQYDSQTRIQEVEFTLAQEPAQTGLKPGYLGISGTDAPSGGVELQQVFPGTVAHQAGLQSGDVLVDIDGEKLAGYAALAERIRAAGEGKPMSLRVRRAGVEFALGVQLGARP